MEAETEHYLMDELEAGEAAVELDDKEPQEVLAWAIENSVADWASARAFRRKAAS